MITSIVIRGDGAAKLTGFPTANLNVRRSEVPLPPGVYAAWATLNRATYQAALVIHSEPWKVEVFFMNYSGADFYGSRVAVEPIQKISEIESYDSPGELHDKIESDLVLIRDLFAERGK
ncbi:MAG: Riboflavin biosynthesis protein RibF [Candidatus Magasanikbacteria bacterium GW2011_GWA2_56_11]|uniref:riboflavin kinase n=1 Tax=Candidatus Magasanikbacteria bacterium GW2011_GWA2_56_11 TaxID=1619044 RepID=A0A0G1YEV1_9BACT|nr:MAG: Riboflavin biosynthesis protein RibF [Candidatus Magasanikbacteria bacterium GW2011_GWA2_56_11]